MMRNMGTIDRVVRFILALGVTILYFTNVISATAALILGGLAIIFMVTSAVGVCPLYLPCKINTSGK